LRRAAPHSKLRRAAPHANLTRDAGAALVIALVVTSLLAALGLGVVTIASVDTALASAVRSDYAASLAANAAAERAMQDLAILPSWSAALAGDALSTFGGGPSAVDVPGRGRVDLLLETAVAQARSDAYWQLGANNPRWRLYASGWLREATADAEDGDLPFVAVWVFDDCGETDTDPETDSNGRVGLRAVAYGPRGAERAVDVVIAQLTDPVGVRVITWRSMQ
jgi:hypothetical protein